MKHIIAFVLLLIATQATFAKTLDLSDCNALKSAEVNAYEQDNKGVLSAHEALTAIAVNRFSCFEEELTGNSGWSVQTSSESDDKSSKITVFSNLPKIQNIQNHPTALNALKAAYEQTKGVNFKNIGESQLSTTYVARYPEAFPNQIAAAYKDAYVIHQYACLYKKPIGKTDRESLCQDPSMSQLFKMIEPNERLQIEAQGRHELPSIQYPENTAKQNTEQTSGGY